MEAVRQRRPTTTVRARPSPGPQVQSDPQAKMEASVKELTVTADRAPAIPQVWRGRPHPRTADPRTFSAVDLRPTGVARTVAADTARQCPAADLTVVAIAPLPRVAAPMAVTGHPPAAPTVVDTAPRPAAPTVADTAEAQSLVDPMVAEHPPLTAEAPTEAAAVTTVVAAEVRPTAAAEAAHTPPPAEATAAIANVLQSETKSAVPQGGALFCPVF